MEAENCIMRFGPPNEMDKFPYGTRIKVHKEKEQYDLYIQSNKDENTPIWISIGPFNNDVEYIQPDK